MPILCKAAKNGSETMVKMLLEHGADVNVADKQGNTALHLSTSNAVSETLLNAGANINGVVAQLLDCKADCGLTTKECKKYPLMIACEREFANIAMMLLDRGADANVSEDTETPLKLAAANGDAVLVKRLLADGADVNTMRNISDTALHVAVERCRGLCNKAFVNIVQILLKSGADPNALNHRAETPLFLAYRPTNSHLNIDIVQLLLEHGADPNTCPARVRACPTGLNSSAWSPNIALPPLKYATICNNSELAMLLIKFGASVDQSDDRGRTALHFAVSHMGYVRGMESEQWNALVQLVQLLLDRGASVNLASEDGETPFYIACSMGLRSIAEKMLENGAKVDGNSAVMLPLIAACTYERVSVVELLLTIGANPNVRREQSIENRYLCSLHIATAAGNAELVKLLLKHDAHADIADINGNTALHHAVKPIREPWSLRNGVASKLIMDILLENKADVNKVNNFGETPLYRAVSEGLLDVVNDMLLVYGGNANRGSPDKSHLVAAFEKLISNRRYQSTEGKRIKLSAIRLLLEHGASFDTPTPDGLSVMHHFAGAIRTSVGLERVLSFQLHNKI